MPYRCTCRPSIRPPVKKLSVETFVVKNVVKKRLIKNLGYGSFSQKLTQRIASSVVKTVLLLCVLIPFNFAFAQTTNEREPLTPEKLAAVMNVINFYVLGEPGGPIDLELNASSSKSYGFRYGSGDYKDGLEINFAGQSQSVTLCFDTEDIQANEVAVQLNGAEIGTLQAGENCFTFTAGQQQTDNVFTLVHNNPGDRWGISNVGYDLTNEVVLTLPVVSRAAWDNLAVRKVLEVFAFGGQASDTQIQLWADMDPQAAIAEMLNFAPHNLKLAPLLAGEKYTEPAFLDGTFWGFRQYMSSLSSNLPIALTENNNERRGLGVDNYDSQGAWVRMTTARGLNPFRQKIGYWETNYHLAVNLDAGVTSRQLTYYYDLIMNAHAAGMPYQQVIAEAAKSAAVAFQYGHNENRWIRESINGGDRNGDFICECNEDFAREIHQLFFGILGEQDPHPDGLQHHEDVTIPETAKALTDMRVLYDKPNERFLEVVDFQTEFHHLNSVDVLNTQISGGNAAAKIDAIAAVAINHSESMANLPIIIIEGLADDELTEQKKQQLRAAWAAMPSKNFLQFIHAYAVSELFHANDRVKYFPSVERFIYIANKLILNNTEALRDHYRIGANWVGARSFGAENVEAFRPLHNVFGGQTGVEASDAPAVMENNYNRFTDGEWQQRFSVCDDCDNNGEWRKNWALVIPKIGGRYKVDDVAAWLWRHFVNDEGKNYTQIERAHMLALMATNRDLNQLYCVRERRIAENIQPSQNDINNGYTALELLERDNPWDSTTQRRCDEDLSTEELLLLEKGFSSAELDQPAIAALINEMGNRSLALDSNDLEARAEANEDVGQGINFILATPFIMAQEAR